MIGRMMITMLQQQEQRAHREARKPGLWTCLDWLWPSVSMPVDGDDEGRVTCFR
jgi:hypothetical protein